MNTFSSTLILGAEGQIGHALSVSFTRQNQLFIGTSMEKGAKFFFELSQAKTWTPPAEVTHAVMCAGVTSIEACETSPKETAFLNVDCTIETLKILRDRGVFSLFMSSNLVFDLGELKDFTEDSPVSPKVEYGRQKAAVEKWMRAEYPDSAILRPTKIIPAHFKLFEDWQAAIAQGRAIEPFSDLLLSPVPMSGVVRVIETILKRRLKGIFHYSGDRDVSYAQVAQQIGRVRGWDSSHVQPKTSAGAARYLPKATTLNARRTSQELQIQRVPLEEGLSDYLFPGS